MEQKIPEQWLLHLIDSWGKIPAGLFSGHLRELGNFDQCLKFDHKFKEKNQGSFKGQYCTGMIPLKVLNDFLNISLEVGPSVIPTKDIGLQLGICLPDTCTPAKINDLWTYMLNLIASDVEITNTLITNCEINKDIKYTAVDYVAFVVFCLVGFFMLTSTIYDYVTRQQKQKPNDLLIAFSVITNGEKLFKISTNKSPNTIECLNGIRCISIVWIVLGHSYVTYSATSIINNLDLLGWLKSFFATFFQFGTVSVDTFLFLSGLLIIWSAFREMEKTNGRLNIIMMYIHRYLRLTPALAAAILFCVSFIKYIGSGPFWQQSILTSLVNPCENKWWASLIYVQNYVGKLEICVPHSWYLAVDTQLYLLSPLILIPLWKWGSKIILPLVVLALLSNACVFAIFMKWDFSTIKLAESVFTMDRMRLTYMPTHARYAPWLIGVIVGFYLFQYRNCKINLKKPIVILGWLISISLILAVVVAPYNRIREGGGDASKIESAFYESLNRTTWAVALGWIVFACHHGYGGIINSMLSWSIWEPFSRLTYSIYIVHFIIQYMVNANIKNEKYFSNFDVIYKFWGDFGLTLCISILWVLGFESPIIGIEKVLFKRGKNTTDDCKQLTINNNDEHKSNESLDDIEIKRNLNQKRV